MKNVIILILLSIGTVCFGQGVTPDGSPATTKNNLGSYTIQKSFRVPLSFQPYYETVSGNNVPDSLAALWEAGGYMWYHDGITRIKLANASGVVNSLVGTPNQITVLGSINDTVSISTTYPGQTSINTVGTLTSGTWDASIVQPPYGGTGLNTYATGDLIYASSVSVLSKRSIGSSGQLLTVSGGLPAWVTAPFVSSVSGVTNRTTVTGTLNPIVDISASYSGQSSIQTVGTIISGAWNATTVSPLYGGTGLNTYATGDLIYASAANTLSKLPASVNGYVLTLISGIPSWQPDNPGTITGVTAGRDLIGGGTSGGVTVSIDTSKVAELGGNNAAVNVTIGAKTKVPVNIIVNGVIVGVYDTAGNFKVNGVDTSRGIYVSGGVSGTLGNGHVTIGNSASGTPQTNKVFLGIGDVSDIGLNAGYIGAATTSTFGATTPCIAMNAGTWTLRSITTFGFNSAATIAGANNLTGVTNLSFTVGGTGSAYAPTSGTTTGWSFNTSSSSSGAWTAASGSGTYNHLLLQQIINQTGSATGTIRGLYINPTITAVTGSYRGIETSNSSGYSFYGNGTAPLFSKGNLLLGSAVDNGTGDVLQSSGPIDLTAPTYASGSYAYLIRNSSNSGQVQSVNSLPTSDLSDTTLTATGNTQYDVKANRRIIGIAIKPVGTETIKVGTTSGGTDIVPSQSFAAGVYTTITTIHFFSQTAIQTLYIQGAVGSVTYKILQ